MPSELYEPFFKTIGATEQEHTRVLEMMQTDEVMTLIQKGSARYLAHTCRLGGRHGKI